MTARRRSLAGVLLAAIVGALAWQMFRPRMPDPIFEGQHLSYWVGRSDGTESLTAQAAVRAAGTNAIPMLLHFMRAHDSAFKRRMRDLIENFDLSDKQLKFLSLHFTSSDDHTRAVSGFETIGPAAKSAVPELLRIYKADASQDSRMFVLQALAAIGPAAKDSKEVIPLLKNDATNTDAMTRWYAINALANLSADDLSAPELIRGLKHRLPPHRVYIEPFAGIPELIKALNDPPIRRFAVFKLGSLGPQAKSAVPSLLELRRSVFLGPDPWMVKLIDEALRKIDLASATNAGLQTTNAPLAQ